MVEKYIIMCGGNYKHWEKPRHLSVVMGEELVGRTIRLLRENGIKDISISSNNPIFEKFGVPVLKHNNLYNCMWHKIEEGSWFNCFYPTEEPVCYIFGDVYFSEEAIKKIVETETDDIEFFGSKAPFSDNYIKNHEEPFALKVYNTEHLKKSIEKTKQLDKEGKFWRKPIMWELWTVIKDIPLQTKSEEYPAEYIVINDYTCDIDWKEDINKLNHILGGDKMVKLEATINFTLEKFDEIKIIERKSIDTKGRLYPGDIFECNQEMADYILGKNAKGIVAGKIIEITPEEKVNELGNPVGARKLEKELAGFDSVSELSVEEKPKKKRTKKNLQDK